MKNILSIDGGGIRGLIPVSVLAELERLTGKSVAKIFDLVAGTSTGGIISLMLTRPGRDGQPLYSAEQVKSFYLADGPKIFSRSVFHTITSVNGFLDEKYPSKQLSQSLQSYLGQSLLSESLTKVLVSAYDLQSRQPLFFKSHKAVTDSAYNFRRWEAALATSSAPSYFTPAVIWNGAGQQFPLIDGGVFGTNVAMCAYAEARLLWPDEPVRILSLGCGFQSGPYDPKKLSTGQVGWIAPLLDVMLQGSSVTVDYQMRQVGCEYYRLQPQLKFANGEMDDASAKNMQNLQADATLLIRDNAAVLCHLADTYAAAAAIF